MTTYLTFEELFGSKAPIRAVVEWLQGKQAGQVLASCGALLGMIQSPNVSLQQLSFGLADVFVEPYRQKARNLVRGNRAMIAPQGVMKLAKMALLYSRGDLDEAARHIDLVIPLLGIQEHLGSNPRWSGSVLPGLSPDSDPRLIAELCRNQDLNRALNESSALAAFVRRWLTLPDQLRDHPEYTNLMDAYRSATGSDLQDTFAVGIALWGHAATGQGSHGVVNADHISELTGWSKERVASAIHPFTISVAKLKAQVLKNPDSAVDDWSFDEFRRWPVVEWDSRLIILSPDLLIDRITGWPLALDLKHFKAAKGAVQHRTENFYRQVCEAQVHQSLDNLAGGSGSLRRFWSGDDLKDAFGVQTKVADAAVEYDEGWVVYEVTTSQFRRSALLEGNLDEIRRDIVRCVIKKARQLHVMIDKIREAEERLTGHPPASRRVFAPVLIVTEGLPLNPMTHSCISQLLREESLLQDVDTLPLEILDSGDLDMLEGVLAHGSGTALNYLRSHAASNLRSMPFNTWLLDTHRPDVRRSDRITALMNEAFAYAGDALGVPLGEAATTDGPAPAE
ncbi:MAG: hypothetical protein ACRCSN_09910 [Dermatophilaceae bacterium]